MSPPPRKKPASGRANRTDPLAAARAAALAADEIIGITPPADAPAPNDVAEADTARDLIRTVARRVANTQSRLTGGNTLEILGRLANDSLLLTPMNVGKDGTTPETERRSGKVTDNGKTLKDALDEVDTASLGEMFRSERARLNDYLVYSQIYALITQASEAVQTFVDNIVSPDDFTKRDLTPFYDGVTADRNETFQAAARGIIERYKLEDRQEEAIQKSLVKGDMFVAVLNLGQELSTLLTETGAVITGAVPQPDAFTANDIPLLSVTESATLLGESTDASAAVAADGATRDAVATYLNELVTFHQDTTAMALTEALNAETTKRDLAQREIKRNGERPGKPTATKVQTESVRGSVLRMIEPENVIKLQQNGVLFGYFYVELSGPDLSDLNKRGAMDQSTVVASIDQTLSARTLGNGAAGLMAERGKDAIISRLIVSTLARKMKAPGFVNDNPEVAGDAYVILKRARQENKRATFTFIAPDQMVHFTPDGATGYGDSVLSRVKFLAKLYIGAMTNAFMRNSIRQPEKLVWYLDIGADNDGAGSIQNFIRTIKQREVKFDSLKDITTTINQVGQFHDFYVPTYGGQRPVEVETLNMGAAAEVDNAYLDFLRKNIIAGMGVPAAFLGYSEEVAFARSLSMDNGRFLRRVVRHQKHYGRAATKLFRALWLNEFRSVAEIEKLGSRSGSNPAQEPEKKTAKSGTKDSVPRDPLHDIDVASIEVRYPSPATLNMTNLSDAINSATPVVDFIATALAENEEAPVQSALKRMILTEMMPQIHWDRYAKMLDDAKREVARKAANPSPPAPAAA